MHTSILLADRILEATNAAMFALFAYGLVIFGGYVWEQRAELYTDIKPALAFGVVCLGEASLRGVIWAFHVLVEHHAAPSEMVSFVGLASSAAVITIGMLCVIRVFSRSGMGARNWLTAFALSIAAAGVSQVMRAW